MNKKIVAGIEHGQVMIAARYDQSSFYNLKPETPFFWWADDWGDVVSDVHIIASASICKVT